MDILRNYLPSSILQALMAQAVKTPNVVKACNKKGLYEELEDIQTRLSVCEKALTESIETKHLAFPCFYYISSADLLDVHSIGTMWFQLNRNLP